MNLQAITFKSLLFLVFAYAAGYFSFSYLWILFLSLLWLLDAKLTKKRVEERVMQDVRDLEKNLYHYDEMRLECAELITLLPEWARNPSTESVGWMNAIIVKLWPGLRHVLKSTILGNLGYYTIYYKPGWMDKLFVHHVDVGSNPLLIEGIELMESRSDMIIMDLSLRMAWHDALIYIKMAFKGISIPIKISDINFSCKLRLKMSPLITQWPCFGELAVGFVGTPQVDLHLSVGGLPISSVPLLHGWLMQYMTDMCVWCMGYPVMLPFPMVDPPSAEEKAAQQLPPQGILRVVVHKMLYLNKSSGKIRRTVLNSRVKCDVGIGTRMQQTTPVDYHKKVTPINQPFEIIVHDLKTEQLIVKVRTSGMDLMTAANKGKATFDLNMLHANKPVQVWHPLEGAKSGHVLVSMTWKPFIHDGLGILQSAIKSEGSFSCAALHLRVRKAQVNYQELRDRSKNIDSRVSIQCGTQFRKTRVVEKTNHPNFDEGFVIPVRDLFQDTLEVTVERNVGTSVMKHFETISTLRIQLQDYLKMGEHSSFFPFRNDMGGLTLSLEVLQLDPTHNMPPPATPIRGILTVTLHSGKDLPVMDNSGASDPFVYLTCAKKRIKSKVAKKTLDPRWDQSFSFRIEDLMAEVLYLDVFDNDMIADDRMGTLLVPCAQLALGSISNQHFLLEHAPSGSINLSLDWTPDEALSVQDTLVLRSHLLRNASVDFATGGHKSRIASHTMQACRGATVCVAEIMESGGGEQKKRVANSRSASMFLQTSPPTLKASRALTSKAPSATNESTRRSMACTATLDMAMQAPTRPLILPVDEGADGDDILAGVEQKQDPIFMPMEVDSIANLESVRVQIHWCKDLVAADKNGLSDPFVSVSVLDAEGKKLKKLKTSKKTKTLNPMFEQTLEFTAKSCKSRRARLDTGCSLLFKVYDHDRFSSDDLLGQVRLELTDVLLADVTREEHRLHDAESGFVCFSVSTEEEEIEEEKIEEEN